MPRSVYKLKKKQKTTRSARVKPRRRVVRWERVFLFFGILLISFWAVHKFLYYRSLALSRGQATQILHAEPKAAPLPVHIFIPWNSNVDIEPLSFTNGEWQISDTKATYLLGSARPGEQGNIIIYGHNKREILGNIRALKGGEPITIRTDDGKDHVYLVKRTQEVSPNDISLLAPTTTEVLTLYTCSGLLDSQRFLVRAEPVMSSK